MIPAVRCTCKALLLFGGLAISVAYTPPALEQSLEHASSPDAGRLLRKQDKLRLAVAVDSHADVSKPFNLGNPESLAMMEEDSGDGDGDGDGDGEAAEATEEAAEAPAEGAAEGADAAEGAAEGAADGAAEGAADGAADGAEGAAEGAEAEAAPAEGGEGEAATTAAEATTAATTAAATTVAATTAAAGAATTAAATTAVPTTVALATGAGKAHKAKAVLPDAKGKHDSGSHEHHEHAKAKGKSKGKSKSSGSSGNLPWKPILLVTLVVALVAFAGPKLYEMATAKPQLPGRLNEIKSDPADQEVWAKSKARQTYRKSVLAAQSNKSSSDSEDGNKPATRGSASASNEATPSPQKEGSKNCDSSREEAPRLSSSSRTRSPSAGSGSYQARRAAAKAKAAAAAAEA